MTESDLLRQIDELAFICLDLNLYLDTHPDCKPARRDFGCYAAQLEALRETYQREYGPLVACCGASGNLPFEWACSPWPWERAPE